MKMVDIDSLSSRELQEYMQKASRREAENRRKAENGSGSMMEKYYDLFSNDPEEAERQYTRAMNGM